MPCGDLETNRYTDAVVSDIKKKLNLDFVYRIFGGSNYAVFFETIKESSIRYPIILIDTVANFTFDCIRYNLKRPNGTVAVLNHDFVYTLPYAYGIRLSIYYDKDTEAEADAIEERIRTLYANEAEVWVDVYVPGFNGNKSLVKLCVDPAKQESAQATERKNGLIKVIPFKQYYSVYYFRGWDASTLDRDPKQQFAVLQIAEFSILTYTKLKSAVYFIETDYKPFVTHEKNQMKSFFSSEYRRIKRQYDRGLPVDQALFETAFKEIVKIFPQLVSLFKNGRGYNEILCIVKERIAELKERYTDACDDLNLPESIDGKHIKGFNCREQKNLANLLHATKGKYVLLDTAIKEYIEKLDAEKQEIIDRRLAESRGAAEFRDDGDGYSRGYDAPSGGGFLRNTISTAAGVYIGQRMADKKREKEASNKKPDLWGTAACPYGEPEKKYNKNAPDFAHIACNIGCPKWNMCSHWNNS